jgi:hypothetical protein
LKPVICALILREGDSLHQCFLLDVVQKYFSASDENLPRKLVTNHLKHLYTITDYIPRFPKTTEHVY